MLPFSIVMLSLILGCVQPNFETQDYACQEFIKHGSYNTTFIKIKDYSGYYDQDAYVGIVKEATSQIKQGFFSNDIRAKIVFKDGVTITSDKHVITSQSGWGENRTYLVIVPEFNMYELDCK